MLTAARPALSSARFAHLRASSRASIWRSRVWRPGSCPNADRGFGSSRTTARAVARRGCPLRAGRGRAERRRKCCLDRGEVMLVRPRPEERSRDERRREWSAGRRACRKARGTFQGVLDTKRRTALPPSFEGERKGRRRPSANDTTGRRNSPIRLRCLTCESDHCATRAERLPRRRTTSHGLAVMVACPGRKPGHNAFAGVRRAALRSAEYPAASPARTAPRS